MSTRNINLKTAAQESSRKLGKPCAIHDPHCREGKNSEEEWDVPEFSSLRELKNIVKTPRKRCALTIPTRSAGA